jgi:HD superfamily phosphohydrolase
MTVKGKIVNDPVFGFINVDDDLLLWLMSHPYLQRLTRIRQLGLAFYVYPGAVHTRFHHSIGAMHLMSEAIAQLRLRGHDISDDERQAAMACILMHDLGHGPFSHVLEDIFISGVHHEDISLMLMQRINAETGGRLDMAISIFCDTHPKRFLHQLVSGQLDVDRLDYLRRDSYFTGVTEGNIGSARIIKMLNLKDGRIVVEAKGIYSIENFLMARRLMFWQVYLHKTAVAAEKMLVKTMLRAKTLASGDQAPEMSDPMKFFLSQRIDKAFLEQHPEALDRYADIDDNDLWCALKAWTRSTDKTLALLSSGLVNRKLFKIEYFTQPVSEETITEKIKELAVHFNLPFDDAAFLASADVISTNMYSEADDSIDILFKDGSVKDISLASDMLNIELLSKKIGKHYLCYLPCTENDTTAPLTKQTH